MINENQIEFIVFAPGYDPNKGGFLVLHYLCHLLNKYGYKAWIVPAFQSAEVSPIHTDQEIREVFSVRKNLKEEPFFLNPDWETPLYRKPWRAVQKKDHVVVIYPETIFGNPLRAKNVARWLLNTPGFFSKSVYFTPGEVHFRYLLMHRAVPVPWIEVSGQLLTVMYIPWEHYRPPLLPVERQGTAYLLRKGFKKPLVHDLADSIKIDGMSHAEIGQIFRRVKTFISYDSKTQYSSLAAIAGADSVVIPDPGVGEEDWLPEESLRVGVAYGFERLEWARSTRHLAAARYRDLEQSSAESVIDFARFWEERLRRSDHADGIPAIG